MASAPIQLMIFSGSVRKAKTVAGGAAIWVSRRTRSGSVIRVSQGCASVPPTIAPNRSGSGVTKRARDRHDGLMQLSPTLAWLLDAAAETASADRLLACLGAPLVADGLPLAGGT